MTDPRRTRAYQRFRHAILTRDGHRCLACGATELLEVDHVVPIYDAPERAMDASNVQTLCRSCNRRKGPATIDYRSQSMVPTGAVIVTGPPGAGKSWYVEANREPHDRVIDFDLIARAIGSRSRGNDHTEAHTAFALVAWDALVEAALTMPSTTWVVHARPSPEAMARYRVAGATTMGPTGEGVGVFAPYEGYPPPGGAAETGTDLEPAPILSAGLTSADTSLPLSPSPTPGEPKGTESGNAESGRAATERARSRWGLSDGS